MRIASYKKLWLVAVVLSLACIVLVVQSKSRLAGVFDSRITSSSSGLSGLPPIMLWAWERPERLEFIDPGKVGVAFLAKTVYLKADSILVKPRLQPLNVPPDTTLVAVTRVETDKRARPFFNQSQLDRLSLEIIRSAHVTNVHAVQIDFDATLSERDFYRKLLTQVRDDLPKATGLSITALASWCAGDEWLTELPVDEAVPMLFRMGIEDRQFRSRLASGFQFHSAPCSTSAGVSTDEDLKAPPVKHLYIFSPDSWSQESFNKAMETYNR